MKKFFKYTFRILLLAFIVIQFIRPAKNKSEAVQANHISKAFPVPDSVHSILKTACYDCHSNNTNYPWYSYVQPVAWWLDDHIKHGKKELNFDSFASYKPRRQFRKLEEINSEVKENKMPLDSYTYIHKDAVLTDAQKLLIANWTLACQDSLKAHHHIDSLVRKKN